jgi:hypothetical protein
MVVPLLMDTAKASMANPNAIRSSVRASISKIKDEYSSKMREVKMGGGY